MHRISDCSGKWSWWGNQILAISENRRRLCLYRNNRRRRGQLDMTGAFSESNWSRFCVSRSSDFRWRGESGDVRGGQEQSESGRIGLDFACTATTGVATDNWRLRANSARQIGLDSASQEVLTVDGEWRVVMFEGDENSRNL